MDDVIKTEDAVAKLMEEIEWLETEIAKAHYRRMCIAGADKWAAPVLIDELRHTGMERNHEENSG